MIAVAVEKVNELLLRFSATKETFPTGKLNSLVVMMNEAFPMSDFLTYN